MPAASFKAECLAVLDRVAATGETVVVTNGAGQSPKSCH